MIFQSYNQQTTFDLAKGLARELKGGETIGLIGDLGAGKTVFAQGLAKGLGVKSNVNSPTFVLMKVYKVSAGKIKRLIHIDAYRLDSAVDLENLGLLDYLGKPENVVVIEWADKVKKILPKNAKLIKFKARSEGGRSIKI